MKLYCCATQASRDADPLNAGELDFYMRVDTLKRNKPCWSSCGIVEVGVDIAGRSEVVVGVQRYVTAKEAMAEESEFMAVIEILKKALPKNVDDEVLYSALTFWRAGVKRRLAPKWEKGE